MPNQSSLEQSPLFVCGLPRTGTSLLLSLLDGHPQLVVASHESKFFLTFLRQSRGLDEQDALRLAEDTLFLVWKSGDYQEKYLSHVGEDEVFAAFRRRIEGSDKHPADYLTHSVLAYGEASGQLGGDRKYWVEKTPFTERYADFVFEHWEQARFVHMIRDPRDLLRTYQNRDQHHGRRVTPVASVLHSWTESANLCRRNQQRFGADRYLEMRYEDLTRQPETELARLREFIAIDDHEILRQPTRGAGQVGWQGNAVTQRFAGIDDRQVGRWRDQDPGKHRVVEAVVRDEMQQHRYEPELEPTLGARLSALGCVAVNSARPVLSWIRGRTT